MLEDLTPEQRERARVVCEVFGVTLQDVEALDQADGWTQSRREEAERVAAYRRRMEKRLPQLAAEVTERARAEFGLPEDMHFVWTAEDGR